MTNPDGGYRFDNLPPGDYMVRVVEDTLPAGYDQTGDPDGTMDATSTVSLGNGEDNLDQDFGFYPTAASVTIEKATNGDDADSAPGPELTPGDAVTWTYVVTNTGNARLIDLNVTDSRGVTVSCPETELAPGASMTCTGSGQAVAGAYENIGTVTGTPVDAAGNPLGDAVSDTDPSHYVGTTTAPARVGDTVWYDWNDDGIQGPGEAGIAGVTVRLYDADTGQVVLTAETDDGNYLFDNLLPGTGRHV